MTLRRVLVAALAVLVLLPALGLGAAALLLDGEALNARAVAAVGQATGRALTIAGPVRVSWSLVPSLSAEGLSLANPPGMSRPALATLARLDAQVALWPLLQRRLELRNVTLTGLDVLLERDAAGAPNWVFARPAPSPQAAPVAQGAPSARMMVAVDLLRVRDSRAAWLDSGKLTTLAIPALTAQAGESGTAINGTLALNEVPLSLTGTTGVLASAGGPWPVDLTLTGAGATLRAAGVVGGTVALTGHVDDLAGLSGMAGRTLPPLRDVQAAAQLGPAGWSALNAQATGSFAGVQGVGLTVAAAAPDGRATLRAEWASAAGPAVLTAATPSLAALFHPGPIPVEARLEAAGAAATLDGMADPRTRAFDVQVSAHVADPAAFLDTPLLRAAGWRSLALDTHAATAAGGTVLLRGLRLTMAGGDAAGDLAVTAAPRPALRGTLVSQRLDFGALLPGRATGAVPSGAAPAASPPPPLPSAPPAAGPLFSDAPLPYEALRRADADVQWSVGEASWRGVALRSLAARLLLGEGRLALDPVQAQAPGGRVSGALMADAGAQAVSLSLQAPGLAAGPLLAAALGSEAGSGTLDLDIAVQGRGASPRALAAGLDGHAGVALVDGDFDLGGILALLANALPKGLPVPAGGRSKVRCLALRVDAAKGQATLGTLLLDSARLHLDGDGTADLGAETLDLTLRPTVRLALGGVSVPVRVTGPFRLPRAQADIKAGAGHSGLLIGTPPPPDECGPKLDAARGGRPGPLPASQPEAPRSKPGDLLRNLLR